jgi:hypothetical protein
MMVGLSKGIILLSSMIDQLIIGGDLMTIKSKWNQRRLCLKKPMVEETSINQESQLTVLSTLIRKLLLKSLNTRL